MTNQIVQIAPRLASPLERLWDILQWRRPHGSRSHKKFCRQWLRPVFGAPDSDGNYFLVVGQSPIMFTAHHDTVHRAGGIQRIDLKAGVITLASDEKESNCLGADCGTGIWLILEMIAARVPGRYAIFSEEETGCHGSRAFVDNREADWQGTRAVISFDRKGLGSIITHQSSLRTCSDDFAESLSDALGMGHKADDGGSYTDSNEFRGVVAECTNLSVGYFAQHSRNESQDAEYAMELRNALIEAPWNELRFSRKPGEIEWLYPDWRAAADLFRKPVARNDWSDLLELVETYPEAVANILEGMGMDATTLREEIDAAYGLESRS